MVHGAVNEAYSIQILADDTETLIAELKAREIFHNWARYEYGSGSGGLFRSFLCIIYNTQDYASFVPRNDPTSNSHLDVNHHLLRRGYAEGLQHSDSATLDSAAPTTDFF